MHRQTPVLPQRSGIIGGFAILAAMLVPAEAARSAEPATPKYELVDIIGLALERHPVMASAEGRVAQSQGGRIAARAYPNPSVTGNSGRGQIRDAGRADIAQIADPRAITEYNLTVGQPLEWPAKRAARQRAAEAGLEGARALLGETRVNLVADVKNGFYQLLLAEQKTKLAEQNLATMEKVAKAVKARVSSGESAPFDAIKVDTEVRKAEQEVIRARNEVRVARVTLDTLTAGGLGATYRIEGDFLPLPSGLDLERLAARALDLHPVIQRLKKQVEEAEYSLDHERQARVPNLTVNGSYWREIGREAFTAGLSVPLPLWYLRQGEIASALGNKRTQEAELHLVRNDLVKAVTQDFQVAQTADEQIDVFEEGLLKQAEEALRIAQLSFQFGAASLLEVLDAQRVLRQNQVGYAQARYELSFALVELERSVGGTLNGTE